MAWIRAWRGRGRAVQDPRCRTGDAGEAASRGGHGGCRRRRRRGGCGGRTTGGWHVFFRFRDDWLAAPGRSAGATGLRRREAEAWNVKRFFCLHFILFISRKKNRIVFANWTGPTMNRYLGRVVRVLHKRIYRTSAGAATANLLC
jgi:hypothetical protein